MSNQAFLQAINKSFQSYLKTGARSNEKLKVLHGFIARVLVDKLGDDYKVVSLGYGNSREQKIKGRYIDKNVDIVVLKNEETIAGIGVKFVMSNYAQNSNNYFENMLGETANIRSNNIPYFQILILTHHAPYFEKDGTISKMEEITKNNLHKYIVLSTDNTAMYLHSPNKTLIYIVKIKSDDSTTKRVSESKANYADSFAENSNFETHFVDGVSFDKNVILNDFEEYIEKVVHLILGV
jgi:hypothetical protein